MRGRWLLARAIRKLRGLRASLQSRASTKAVMSTNPLRRLLVVCHGNIHRSPFAAAVLGKSLAGFSEVRSSGLHRQPGRPCPPGWLAQASACGVDLSTHLSTAIGAADLAWADAVVLMDRRNWLALTESYGDSAKLVWLGAFDGEGDIPDPYGRTEEEGRRIMRRLQSCCAALADEILRRRRLSTA
jgi:protein-tyrosine-phosphatase